MMTIMMTTTTMIKVMIVAVMPYHNNAGDDDGVKRIRHFAGQDQEESSSDGHTSAKQSRRISLHG